MILVGVTVSVALNGGLFDITKTAAIKQEMATMQELISAQEAKILADKAENGQEQSTVSAQEILKSYGVTSPEVIALATEPTPKYVTNELAAPTGTCYKLDPGILGVETSRGQGTVVEGEVSDIFVIDSNKKVYYIKKATVDASTPPAIGEASDLLLDYILGEVDAEGQRPGKGLFTIIDPETLDSDSTGIGLLNVPRELGALAIPGMIESDSGEEAYITLSQTINDYVNIYQFKANISYNSDETVDAITDPEYTDPEYENQKGVIHIGSYPYSRVGKYVKYNDMTWIVLYDDDEHGVQMVTTEQLSTSVHLASDKYIHSLAPDLNQNGAVDTSEIGIAAYNDVVDFANKTIADIPFDKTFMAKQNDKYLTRALGTDSTLNNFGKEIYNTVVVSESTLPGYGESSTWFEDALNLEKNSDNTGYKIKGTNTEFKLKTSEGTVQPDSEAIQKLPIYTGNGNSNELENYLIKRTVEYNNGYVECNSNGLTNFHVNSGGIIIDEYWYRMYIPFYFAPVIALDKEKFDEFEALATSSGNYGNGTEADPWDLDTRSMELALPSDGEIEFNKYYEGSISGQYADFRVIFFENGITHIHMKNGDGGYMNSDSYITTSRSIDENNRIICSLGGVDLIIFSVQNGCITSFAFSSIENAMVATTQLTNKGFDYNAKDPTGTIYLNMPYVADDGSIRYFFETGLIGSNNAGGHDSGLKLGLGAFGEDGFYVDTENSRVVYDRDRYMGISEDKLTLDGKYTVDPNFRWETAVIE